MAKCPGFREISDSLKKSADGGYRACVAEGWTQGRSIYGGMVAGLALSAAQAEFDGLPPLRSMQVNFIGPISFGAGIEAIFTPSLMRAGKNVRSICVDVSSDLPDGQSQLGARILFTFGKARASELAHLGTSDNEARPEPAPCLDPLMDPKAYPAYIPALIRPLIPKYFLQFETHLIEGHRPLSGKDQAYVLTALRHKDPASHTGFDSLVALADALPPTALIKLRKLAPVGTISWMMNFYGDDPQTEDGWWRLDGRLHQAQGGYSTETLSIWNSEGELVAQGQQCVAIFG